MTLYHVWKEVPEAIVFKFLNGFADNKSGYLKAITNCKDASCNSYQTKRFDSSRYLVWGEMNKTAINNIITLD